MTSESGTTRPVRPRQEMPEDVRRALLAADLMDLYLDRPAYRRDDYLLWIASAKREDTRNRRIAQMLKELEAGGVYMRIPWRGLSSKREYAPRAPEEPSRS